MRGDLSGKLATFWLESKTLFVKSAEEFFAKSSVRRHLSIWQRPERLFSSLLFWGEKRYLKSKISLRPPRKLTYAHFECRWWGRLACITFQSHEQRDTGSPPKTLFKQQYGNFLQIHQPALYPLRKLRVQLSCKNGNFTQCKLQREKKFNTTFRRRVLPFLICAVGPPSDAENSHLKIPHASRIALFGNA